MRDFEPFRWKSGEASIAEIQLDPTSRDDIPQLLRGLQHLYMTDALRKAVFQILDRMLPSEIDRNTGRPGMVLWRIFVLGVLRLNLNWDYDRLCEMVNQHKTIRQILGHGLSDDGVSYHVQWFGHFSQNKLYEFHKLFKNNRLYFYTQFHKLL